VKEAAVPLAHRLNVGNLHDTGRLTDPMPAAAMAEVETPKLKTRHAAWR
jgi:hypothetical protein